MFYEKMIFRNEKWRLDGLVYVILYKIMLWLFLIEGELYL